MRETAYNGRQRPSRRPFEPPLGPLRRPRAALGAGADGCRRRGGAPAQPHTNSLVGTAPGAATLLPAAEGPLLAFCRIARRAAARPRARGGREWAGTRTATRGPPMRPSNEAVKSPRLATSFFWLARTGSSGRLITLCGTTCQPRRAAARPRCEQRGGPLGEIATPSDIFFCEKRTVALPGNQLAPAPRRGGHRC